MRAPLLNLAFALVAALLLVGSSGCAGSGAFSPNPSHGFLARQTRTSQGLHKFWIYRPNHAPAGEKLPVILYLHGGGERGDDGVKQTQVGLGPVVQKTLGYFPFVVVFPQCPKGHFWSLPDMAERAMEALEVAIRDFHGDPDRIYVTGNSMGGFGTWYLGAHHPDRFAALAPICGGVRPPVWVPIPKAARPPASEKDPYSDIAQRVGETPIWIFHGAEDWLIPPHESERMYEAIKRAGGQVRLTEWPGVGHAAEVPTYAEPTLFEWFLEQRRGQPAAAMTPAR